MTATAATANNHPAGFHILLACVLIVSLLSEESRNGARTHFRAALYLHKREAPAAPHRKYPFFQSRGRESRRAGPHRTPVFHKPTCCRGVRVPFLLPDTVRVEWRERSRHCLRRDSMGETVSEEGDMRSRLERGDEAALGTLFSRHR
jgi:hypothetical protein